MKRKANNRRGVTLLELVIASAMLALLLTSASVVLRTSRQAWQAQDDDFKRLDAMHATIRHMVRQVRQAKSVASLSAATDTAGTLSLTMPDGTTTYWRRDAGTNRVYSGVGAANQLLGDNITSLRITGYRADGTTTTTTPALVRSLQIEASVALNREQNGARTVRSWAWVRSW